MNSILSKNNIAALGLLGVAIIIPTYSVHAATILDNNGSTVTEPDSTYGQPATTYPGTNVTVPTTNTGVTAQTQTTSGSASSNFVPLTSLPGIQQIANITNFTGNTFPDLLDQLYVVCIGAAAAITVFQLVRAGIMYMSAGDNTSKVSQARQLIQTAIFGLIVVLAPYIVFSIIDPADLSLNINFSSLTPATTGSTQTTGNTGTQTTSATQNTTDGTVQPGGSCSNDNNCNDANGQNYACINSVCTAETLDIPASTGQ